MKLNIKDNLVNMEMFFREVLGFNCYWGKNEWFRKGLNILYLEVSSFECFLKYINKSEFEDEKIPTPDKLRVFFDRDMKPRHMVADISKEDHELYTTSGIKQVYDFTGNGMTGITRYHAYYFLYCYDREDSGFKSIPVEIVKEIEDFLISKNLNVYDRFYDAKLDIKDNLLNAEMFFKEVLGYKCYRTKERWLRKKVEVLNLEIPSLECFLKYLDQSRSEIKYDTKKMLRGEIPVPVELLTSYDGYPYLKNNPPCYKIADISKENLYDKRGFKRIYVYRSDGTDGTTISHLLYFLYCYDRKDPNFKKIPKKVIKEIEDYLISKNRKVYDYNNDEYMAYLRGIIPSRRKTPSLVINFIDRPPDFIPEPYFIKPQTDTGKTKDKK